MPLSDQQIDDVWKFQISAEVRSLYFADLANTYTVRKQWITGASFFLSSGAAATLIAKLPATVPIVLSLVVAIVTAYSIAVNLDSKIRTMVKLHGGWTQISNDYKRLWNHTYADDAELEFEDLQRREAELSEVATIEAPDDRKRMLRWTDHVFKQHRLENA
jgi:hypothetical protein